MSSSSQPSPLRGLLIAQFFAAFNDNAWKLMVALLGMRTLMDLYPAGPALENAAQHYATQTFVIFTLPLIVISLFAAVVADRVSKRTVLITMKGVEVLLMAVATILLTHPHPSTASLLAILAGMGIHSAFFSPAKYGILPELLPHDQLAKGNGILEFTTFLAILTGTAIGGMLLDHAGESLWCAPLVLMACAMLSFVAAWFIPPVPAARSGGGLIDTVRGAVLVVRKDRVLSLTILASTLFWMIASLVSQDLLVYGKTVLDLSDSMAGIPLAVLSIGIGAGAYLAGRISGERVEYGLIPLGTLGLAVLLGLMWLIAPQLPGMLVLMLGLGLAVGLFIVPINSVLQWRTPSDRRGSVIALSNVCVFTGILCGSLGGGALATLGLNSTDILLAAAVATGVGTLWTCWLHPDAFVRLMLVILTHTMYRIRTVGQTHVPTTGGALLVPNHMSLVDGFLLMASLDRPIRFVVDAKYALHPLFRWLMSRMRVIPIASDGGTRMILRALKEAGHALDQGELVCIFPEGQITRTGTLLPFRRGFERVIKGRTVPIIPVHLDRVWGSIFSFADGRVVSKWPSRIPYPVTVSFGEPQPTTTSTSTIRQIVQELGEQAWWQRKADWDPLHRLLIRSWRRWPNRLAMADLQIPSMSRIRGLTAGILLAHGLRRAWKGQRHVGLLLPPSVPGALANLAALLAGRTSVNLNYTVGRAGMAAAIDQAHVTTVLTSQRFLEKANIELPVTVRPLWIEDYLQQVSLFRRVVGLLLAVAAPARLIERYCGHTTTVTMDDIATVIFSSGSTGEPKGVMLSHFNVTANVEAVSQVMHTDHHDRALAILPFFHSFGFLLLWYAIRNDMSLVFHPSPLDAAVIGNQIAHRKCTILVATPTFLQLYLRRCTPEQLSTLRIVLTGAEKLPARLVDAFAAKFGVIPIEGYGVTECAPVIAVNTPDFRAPGFYQPAHRLGTVGQPLPGVAIRIVDPETRAPQPVGESGLLLVKGPNVMAGYLGRPDLTQHVIIDDWYCTGDMATVDEDGFVTITDRLSRFSKIGGEMVPHGRVEEALHQAAHSDMRVLAVTGVPDEKKGERLIVLHTLHEDDIPAILDALSTMGLPNLFLPTRQAFVKVEALPVLGTGKLDLRAIKRLALDYTTRGAQT